MEKLRRRRVTGQRKVEEKRLSEWEGKQLQDDSLRNDDSLDKR